MFIQINKKEITSGKENVFDPDLFMPDLYSDSHSRCLSDCTAQPAPTQFFCTRDSQATSSSPTTQPAVAVTKDKIVIGMPSELTGPLANVRASAFQPVLDTWLAKVNGAGGLTIAGKKMPVEMKIYDNKSAPRPLRSHMEKLIVQDKVDFILPAGGTSMIFATAPIANKYGYILTTMEGGASQLKGNVTQPAPGNERLFQPGLAMVAYCLIFMRYRFQTQRNYGENKI